MKVVLENAWAVGPLGQSYETIKVSGILVYSGPILDRLSDSIVAALKAADVGVEMRNIKQNWSASALNGS